MIVINANVLDKNEKCISDVQMVLEDGTEVTTVKEYMTQVPGAWYTCGTCRGVHKFDDALFAHQIIRRDWDGKPFKDKDSKAPEFGKPCGEDEFTIKVVKTEGYLNVSRNADNELQIQSYVPGSELPQ